MTVIDKHAAAWKQHANLVPQLEAYGVDVRWSSITTDISLNMHSADLMMQRLLGLPVQDQTKQALLNQAMSRADLVTAQNCLNEISQESDTFLSMLSQMKSGAIFACSDLSGYRPNLRKLHVLREGMANIHRVPDDLDYCRFVGFHYTDELERHFFERVNGLWARRRLNTVSFVSSRKSRGVYRQTRKALG